MLHGVGASAERQRANESRTVLRQYGAYTRRWNEAVTGLRYTQVFVDYPLVKSIHFLQGGSVFSFIKIIKVKLCPFGASTEPQCISDARWCQVFF